MYVQFSKHAFDHMERIAGVMTRKAVIGAVLEAKRLLGSFPIGETAIKIKCLPRVITVHTADGCVSAGDTVYVVYRRRDAGDPGVVTTVELRRASQGPSSRWSQVINVCK